MSITNSATNNLQSTHHSVLDHGFVRLLATMGDDQAVVDAARISYGAGTKKLRQDRKLIRYLMRHAHTTPFEMCEIKFHLAMPLFVARQWIRHRTANINEYSARYSIMPDRFYLPAPEQLAAQSKVNKQGRQTHALSEQRAEEIRQAIKRHNEDSYRLYQSLLADDEKDGIARELARMVLPLNIYTEWYWKIDLHNLLHFLRLRLEHNAQYEIRCYAEVIAEVVQGWVPLCWEAFSDYVIGGHHLSAQQSELVKQRLSQDLTLKQQAPDSNFAKGEWIEFQSWLEG